MSKPAAPPAQAVVAAPAPQQQPVAAVSAPAPAPERPRMPDAATRAKIDELLARIQDAYFDYDKHDIRTDAQTALQADAKTLGDILRDYPDFKLSVQGNCDDRGSEEYNLALGDARAKQAKQYLASLGIPDGQMNTISYGKSKPVCSEDTESCWQKNRRAHLTTAENN